MPEPRTPKPRDKPSGATSHRKAVRGWSSWLAAFVTTVIAVEGITGLWIYLAPFSVASQVQVLLHTVLGLVVVIPYAWYQWRHLADWYRQTVTASMVLGYALMLSVVVSIVTGLVLTWQAAFGPKISPAWDIVHLISGIGVCALIVAHIVAAIVRRRVRDAGHSDLGAARRRFADRGLVWGGSAAVLVVAAALLLPSESPLFPPPEGYSVSETVEGYEEYRGNPFAPSNARTEGDLMVQPHALAGSESCGTAGCHEEILAEWEPSAHRFSAMNPPFQAVQKMFAADRVPAETRYCAGCHDPISLFAGAKDIANQDLSAPGVDEGISCIVCHTISAADKRGNADYVLTPPQEYLFKDGGHVGQFVSHFLIRAYPRQHLDDYDRNLLRTPEFCAACHKQFIPEALNRFGFVEGQNQYNEWLNSHWHTDDTETDLSCRDCHMRLVPESMEPGRGEDGDTRRTADDGAHRHHGFIATNMFMPEVMKLPHWERHVRLTEEWIRGETVLPEIADVWPEGPVASIQIASLPQRAAPGEEVSLRVVVTNRKAGHNFITGPLDFVRSWVHLTVTDADGSTIAEWGAIDPVTRSITDTPGKIHDVERPRDQSTMVFEGNPIDSEGNVIEKHELWRKAGGKSKRVLFPGYSDAHGYKFTVPADAKGPIRVRADLNYRRYRQQFLKLVLPTMERDSGTYQRTVTQDHDEKFVAVGMPVPPGEDGK